MRITVRKARKGIKRNKTISLNRKPNGQCIYCSFGQFYTYLLNSCVMFSTLFHLFHKFPSAPKFLSFVKKNIAPSKEISICLWHGWNKSTLDYPKQINFTYSNSIQKYIDNRMVIHSKVEMIKYIEMINWKASSNGSRYKFQFIACLYVHCFCDSFTIITIGRIFPALKYLLFRDSEMTHVISVRIRVLYTYYCWLWIFVNTSLVCVWRNRSQITTPKQKKIK